ncbi:hypothetical protein J3R83DRAFT_8667 [Lanmaoa asiatica]|nr:hypothetical protein J3R83DRAFT_8667 [Lanmaoa asiatica]
MSRHCMVCILFPPTLLNQAFANYVDANLHFDSHQQRRGPHPNLPRDVLGLRPPLRRGAHSGLRRVDSMSRHALNRSRQPKHTMRSR